LKQQDPSTTPALIVKCSYSIGKPESLDGGGSILISADINIKAVVKS
jgi:hypothetical protein